MKNPNDECRMSKEARNPNPGKAAWPAHSVLECVRPLPLFPPSAHSARGLAQSKTWRTLLTAFLLVSAFSLPLSALSQSYAIDWHKIAGGGGTSTGGIYSVSGTIGQPDASLQQMSGGDYSLTGGFWSLLSVVQTAGAPPLHISHSGNTVTVYWQDVSGWSLQQNNNLSLPSGWSTSGVVTTGNGTNYLNVMNPSGNLFFRLKNP